MPFDTGKNWVELLPEIKNAGSVGVNITQLAERYGVSRQRMKQVIDKHIPNWKDSYGYTVRKKALEDIHFAKWGYREDTDLYRAQRAKFRSKKYNSERIGHEWNLDFGDLSWPTHCPILGIELNYFNEFRSENSPSFDQVIPGQGYVKGNVEIISYRANRIKNDGSAAEHRQIADWLDTLINVTA